MDTTLQNYETVNSETPMTYLIPVQYSILFTNRPLQKTIALLSTFLMTKHEIMCYILDK